MTRKRRTKKVSTPVLKKILVNILIQTMRKTLLRKVKMLCTLIRCIRLIEETLRKDHKIKCLNSFKTNPVTSNFLMKRYSSISKKVKGKF